MKKIEEQMIGAIRRMRSWCKKNTRVFVGFDGVEYSWSVYLHGHRIAWGSYGEHGWKLDGASLRGWDTATTKSRLRALGVDVWRLRCEEGHITKDEYMEHLRKAQAERTRRMLAVG